MRSTRQPLHNGDSGSPLTSLLQVPLLWSDETEFGELHLDLRRIHLDHPLNPRLECTLDRRGFERILRRRRWCGRIEALFINKQKAAYEIADRSRLHHGRVLAAVRCIPEPFG